MYFVADALILTGPLIPRSPPSPPFASAPPLILGAGGLFFCPGFTSSALALWDVDGDSVEDAIVGVTEGTDDTRPTQGNKSEWDQLGRARGPAPNRP